MNANSSDDRVCVGRIAGFQGAALFRSQLVTVSYPRHAHDELSVGVIERGTGTFWCRGQTHHAPARRVVFFLPGEVHTGSRAQDSRVLHYRMLYLSQPLLDELVPRLQSGARSGLAHVIADPALAARWVRVTDCAAEPEGGLALAELCSLLLRTAGLGARDAQSQRVGGETALVRRGREYLHAHFADRVRVGELAAALDRHPSHLARAFTGAIGLSPRAYLLDLRLREARRRLALGRGVGEVAHEVGFADQAHLTRAFRRALGTTPGRFQRALLGARCVQDGTGGAC